VRVVLIEPGPITSEFSERAFTSLPQGDAATRYASSYARAGGIRATSDRFSFGPDHVAVAVRRAMGNAPRARYMAPSFLSCVFALVPFVPTRIMDAVFRWAFGLRDGGPSLASEPRALSR
jgi:hypothetical protein